jgi:hypothetical protein
MKLRSKNILWLLTVFFITGNSMAQRIDLEAWQNATSESPYDVTHFLQNPSGTENFGWNRNHSDAAAGYNKHNTEFASSVYNNTGIESWYWSPVKNADLIWQDVEGLLAGTYRITAFVVAQIYNNSSTKGQCGRGSYLFAGDAQANITSNKWQKMSVTTTIGKNETLRIGIKSDGSNENDWVSIAGVKVECIEFAGFGTLTPISLDEKFDVSVARQFEMADVVLMRTLSSSDYTTLYLPFDMSKELCNKYFSEVLLVTDAKAKDTDELELITSISETIKANTPYLVKGKSSGRVRIEVSPAAITPSESMTKILPSGLQLTGTYRNHEGLDEHFQISGNKCMKRHSSPAHIKGYSFYISNNK